MVSSAAANQLPPPPTTIKIAGSPEVRLRPWQQEAFGIYRDAIGHGDTSLLWEATPGAGKTTAALVVCLHQVRRCQAKSIVIVVPTAHLKTQWARSAVNLGLHINSTFSNSIKVLTSEYSGLVVTYQQVAQQPALFRRLATKACVVLDEVHHAGDGLSWGDALRSAFHDSQFILCLSGTPFRSDSTPIPFVKYDPNGISVPEYSYSYSRAVEDGVCRPTAFLTYGGEVSWKENDSILSARFTDALDHMASSRRLRSALEAESGWITPMLLDAHKMLLQVRREHPEAGALLVAPDQTAARRLAKLLKEITGTPPTVILSDDSEAAKRLKDYRAAETQWLVACNMVSEGVDIPRLRVGVYATTVRTRMYFRQFLGRIVRRVPHVKGHQIAYCYLPADPTLARLAGEVEEEVRHCLNRPKDGEEGFDKERNSTKDREPGDKTWEALSSTNSGLDTVIVHGNQLTLLPDTGAFDHVQSLVTEKVAARLDERRTTSEEKGLIIQEIRKMANVVHKRKGLTHSQIHGQLNIAQGVKSQTVCTEAQLRGRLALLRKMA